MLVWVGHSQASPTELPQTIRPEHILLIPSQGAQIMDNALYGGGDPNQGITYTYPLFTSAASNAIKATIWAGDPRHTTGSPYNYSISTVVALMLARLGSHA